MMRPFPGRNLSEKKAIIIDLVLQEGLQRMPLESYHQGK